MALCLNCLWSKEEYCPGDLISIIIAISHIRGLEIAENSENFGVQFVCVYHNDVRWSKIPNSKEKYGKKVLPSALLTNGRVLFSTSIENCKISEFFHGGCMLQFQLPQYIAPSFKGLSCSISYYLLINLSPKFVGDDIVLPFQIVSGSSTTSNEIFLNIPVSRTPIRSVIHDIFLISESNNQALCSLSIQDSPRHFCIRDDDIICNVIVPCDEKNEIICSPGSILQAVINFEASVQPCHSVKTTLVQVELRHDGSVVQESIISSFAKSALFAVKLTADLMVPSHICSFETSFVKVCYRLDFEFVVEKLAVSSKLESLVFSLPVHVLIFRDPQIGTLVQEAQSCLDSTSSSISYFDFANDV